MPVLPQQPGETAIRKHFAAGLAACAIVRFFVGVTDPQYFVSAARTRLAVASVNGHSRAKRGDLLGEAGLGLGTCLLDPETYCLAGRSEQPFPLDGFLFLRERKRREARRVSHFV